MCMCVCVCVCVSVCVCVCIGGCSLFDTCWSNNDMEQVTKLHGYY